MHNLLAASSMKQRRGSSLADQAIETRSLEMVSYVRILRNVEDVRVSRSVRNEPGDSGPVIGSDSDLL